MNRYCAVLFAFAAIRVLSAVADHSFIDPSRVIQLSWRPRAFLYKGFLSYEECEHLVALAKDKLEKSMVADNESGESMMSEVRTSSGMFLEKRQGKLSQLKDDSWSDCAKNGYAVKPEKGDALLFFSLHPNATTDPKSLHGGCPVIEGEKWSATKWIHVASFESQEVNGSGTACEDANVLCPKWAAVGECTKNHLYMVGSKDSLGFCRKSCNVCTL
ncbi:hypothetical protein ZIOFF_011278 [Zingiber officinale]|uniref:procollagen-proline 4-dioxygenase n=1 Tax=Zingiber officinale TaxID=94328 RepID=A0A8J5M0X8_ZINOF|nr:hypothetical protein ZIOFF_011278 [Zingiber officinale]